MSDEKSFQQPGEQPPGPLHIESTPDERTMAMLCHLSGVISSFLLPLVIWLIKKDQSKLVDDQGKEVLNFHITLLIGHLIGVLTACFVIGFFILTATWICGLVFGIIGAVAAQKGEVYRYPFAIRIIK